MMMIWTRAVRVLAPGASLLPRALPRWQRRALGTLSPAVSVLVSRYGIDPSTLTPSGPKGNLLKGDVLRAINNPSSTSPEEGTRTPSAPTLSSADFPDHTVVFMPALSPTMTSGTITQWVKKEGDSVAPGDVLAEIETDKATVDFEAQEEGFLAKILVPEATQDVEVGKEVAVMVDDKEDIGAFESYTAASQNTDVAVAPPQKATSEPAAPLASTTPVNPKAVTEHSTVVSAAAPIDTSDAFIDMPISDTQRTLAQQALQSKTSIPHYYLTIRCRMDDVRRFQAKYATKGVEVSVHDFVIQAASRAMGKVPLVNSSWGEDAVRSYHDVHINVNIGKYSSILHSVERLGLEDIALQTADLMSKAQKGQLPLHQDGKSTFAVTMLNDVSQVTDTVANTHACVLGMGEVEKILVEGDSGPKVAEVANFTLSCDHRVVDGAVGAQWLQVFKKYFQDREAML